jgi:hypothetical protein
MRQDVNETKLLLLYASSMIWFYNLDIGCREISSDETCFSTVWIRTYEEQITLNTVVENFSRIYVGSFLMFGEVT